MAYFSALVTLAWVLIIINDAATLSKWSIPTQYYVDSSFVGIVVVLALVIIRKMQDIKRYSKK